MKKILITGSEGNIGSKLVPFLEREGHETFCIDIKQKVFQFITNDFLIDFLCVYVFPY